jgi:hypothetical protein
MSLTCRFLDFFQVSAIDASILAAANANRVVLPAPDERRAVIAQAGLRGFSQRCGCSSFGCPILQFRAQDGNFRGCLDAEAFAGGEK